MIVQYPHFVEQKIRSPTHNSPLLVHILSEINPVHAVPSSLFKIHFNIILIYA